MQTLQLALDAISECIGFRTILNLLQAKQYSTALEYVSAALSFCERTGNRILYLAAVRRLRSKWFNLESLLSSMRSCLQDSNTLVRLFPVDSLHWLMGNIPYSSI